MHTKIIATVGPACRSEGMLERLVEAGARVFRLNFSHGGAADFRDVVACLRRLERESGKTLTVLQDLAGPKIRLSDFEGGPLELKVGDVTLLGPSHAREGGSYYLPLDYPDITERLETDDIISLNDGMLRLAVTKPAVNGVVTLQAMNDGAAPPRKGVAFPGKVLPVKAFTEKDRDDVAAGLELGVDAVALSYAQGADDVVDLRRELDRLKSPAALTVKLERQGALDELERIMPMADALMVARGDLGLECPLEQLPEMQKRIITACNRAAKPVIVATQMLLSMVDSPIPTRAETTDSANAVLDGADCLMLSEETAVGRHPDKAVGWLSRIAESAEQLFRERSGGPLRPQREDNAAEFLTYAACRLAENVGAKAIVSHTASGTTAKLLSASRPSMPIFGLTPDAGVLHKLNFSRGVVPKLIDESEPDHLLRAQAFADTDSAFLPSDRMVLIAGQPAPGRDRSETNVLKIYAREP